MRLAESIGAVMKKLAAEQLISDLYKNALGRNPGSAEYESWVNTAIKDLAPEKVVRAFYQCEEYLQKKVVHSTFPAGHYHSPVVDPKSVKDYVTNERGAGLHSLPGIPLDVDSMRKLWLQNLNFIRTTPFTDEASASNRYSYLGGPYPWGDAIILRMMIHHLKPTQIIEIGSGYSSACILDSAEHAFLPDLKLTCIEPYPDRLRSLLRPGDLKSMNLIERPVQEVPESIVDTLGKNDILFIDSTHVMKTGSDVHYEFFHLLPRLAPGVIVHVHDIGFPFEYPDAWIFDSNYSWNEAYALRAFLMFNNEFRVFFWSSLFACSHGASIRDEYPDFLRNPGTSIWIERIAPP
jgi:predicted O-methyltransferase YrrM